MHMLRKTTAGGLLMLGATLASSGCVENDSTLFILGVFDLAATQCLADPNADAVVLATGVLDRAFARSYSAALLVGSHLTQRGSRENLRTETSRLSLEGAHVTVFGTGGGSVSFDTLAAGLVHPASGTDPGLATVFAQLIRPEDLGDPNAGDFGIVGEEGQVVVRVSVFGTTLGGQEIESGDYDFPILICNGCLIDYPTEASNPDTDPALGYRCDPAAQIDSNTSFCYFGQDERVPCTTCAATSEICRNPSANPWYNRTN